MSSAVAVFQTSTVIGEAVAENEKGGVRLRVVFTQLPPGKHGFHIHKGGDLRGEGCKGACEHYHVGNPAKHGPGPQPRHTRRKNRTERHTGDLGNIQVVPGSKHFRRSYFLSGIDVSDLWGRSLIVHADEDDLGKGPHEDSRTTGHSGARIGCAIFGRGY